MAMVEAYDEMEQSARKSDSKGFYEALLNFAETGISSTRNPLLKKIIDGIMPNIRRLQYITLLLKPDALTGNLSYFTSILDALMSGDVEKGVHAVEAYITAEKEFALGVVKNSKLAHYIE